VLALIRKGIKSDSSSASPLFIDTSALCLLLAEISINTNGELKGIMENRKSFREQFFEQFTE